MKRTALAILAILTATVCSLAAIAIAQATAGQTSASSPLDQLDAFVGNVTCTGHEMVGDKATGLAKTARSHGEKTLDGHWVVVRYAEDQPARYRKPFKLVQYFGYDAGRKRYVTVFFDNTGGSYGTGVSAGWKGNTITFEEGSPPGGGHASFRDIFTSDGAGISSHVGMMRDEHGKWVETDDEACHKA